MAEHRATAAPGRPAGKAIDPVPGPAWRRLLIVMPSWVGDCVMAIPLLRTIRAHLPAPGGTEVIAAYLRPHLAPLFESSSLFDQCIAGRPRGLLGPVREAARLRAYGFDTALVLPNSFRAACMTRLAGVPRRIGYDRDLRGWLLSDRVPCPAPGGWGEPIPLIHYYLKLAARLGVETPEETSPGLAPADAELVRARDLLTSHGVVFTRPVVLLNPGASKPGKRWPADRFAALADRLHDSHGAQVVINGSPGERFLTGEIAGRIRRATVLDLAGHETTLATLAAICSVVDLVVTNDTGTRHIAAAVGFERLRHKEPQPGIVTIFGTVPPEWTTLSYPREHELFERGAGRVDAVDLERVVDACCDFLARPSPRATETDL